MKNLLWHLTTLPWLIHLANELKEQLQQPTKKFIDVESVSLTWNVKKSNIS